MGIFETEAFGVAFDGLLGVYRPPDDSSLIRVVFVVPN